MNKRYFGFILIFLIGLIGIFAVFKNKEVIVDNDSSVIPYIDNYLGVKFNYPSSLSLRSLSAVKGDPRSLIYISKTPTKESDEEIDYAIECNKANRADPIGTCVEGITSDIDLYIFNDSTQPGIDVEADMKKRCQISVAENKKIYFCLFTGIDGQEAYSYNVYLAKPSVRMVINTKDRATNQEIIEEIIDSFQSI